jgi:diguanylate cyclase (GGDEF)-like protein
VIAQSRDEMGDLARAFNLMQEAIAERENRVLYNSQHDSLTGLPNRTLALESLIAAIQQAGDTDNVAVIIFDIRNFKSINDAFGHDIGDRVLQAVAERTRAAAKQRDTVVRLGNDEFLLVLARVDVTLCMHIAQRLLAALAQPLSIGGVSLHIEAHLGIATYPVDGDTAEMLVRRADIAMNVCKQQGSGSQAAMVMAYQGGWEESRLRRLALLQNLKDAIAGSGLHLNYQPKLSLSTPAYLGAEALIRWQHPRLGFIGPDEFIPIAENSGNIVALTQWVIDKAIAQIAEWREQGTTVVVSVNISAMDLLENTLPPYVEQKLRQYNVEPSLLCIELTESSAMQDAQHSMAMLQKLQMMGIRISVDDFGTGYSSLAQLKKLNVDELKIDKSFVLKLDQNEDDLVIVRSTIELGHNLGLEVVAEGVENVESQHILKKLGCDMIQGYLLAKPLPPDKFLQWAREHQQMLVI